MTVDSSGIKNIIFDFGGVLFEIDYFKPIEAFSELGYADFGDVYTQANQNPIFDLLETGKVSNEDFWLFLQSHVPGASRNQVEHAWNCILLYLMPEKVRFVKSLREKGYRTFLLSNTNAIHVEVFEKMIDESMGLAEFKTAFEKVYYSNEIGIRKPHPQTFTAICEWNDLNPGETLFIDDSAQHVNGAREAGLKVFHLTKGLEVDKVLQSF
jgi:glucose-1-phosphatase